VLSPTPAGVYTVSALLETARALFEDAFPVLVVEGEISNLARPSSGHLYFTLKDDKAQIRCALFRNRQLGLAIAPRNGQLVRVRARLGIYPARGEMQLIVEYLEDAGEGALRQAYEALRAKLQAEGLFDSARKRPLPGIPKRLALITSPTGAALRDMLQVTRRRFPTLPLLVYPVAVQGATATAQIVDALTRIGSDGLCDVAILARGGGSLEDLQAFNDEQVARAIHSCAVPVVVGVGHETDVTIADFAADLRAPTPSAAAELVAPDGAALSERFGNLGRRLERLLRDQLTSHAQRVDGLERRLAAQHPARVLGAQRLALERLEARLRSTLRAGITERELRLERARHRLAAASPRLRLQRLRNHLEALDGRLEQSQSGRLQQLASRLTLAARSLDAVSPLATLRRGYAVVSRERDHTILRAAREVLPGERVRAQLASGALQCEVLSCLEPEAETIGE